MNIKNMKGLKQTIIVQYRNNMCSIIEGSIKDTESSMKIEGYTVDTNHKLGNIGDDIFFKVEKNKIENVISGDRFSFFSRLLKSFDILEEELIWQVKSIKKRNPFICFFTFKYWKVILDYKGKKIVFNCYAGISYPEEDIMDEIERKIKNGNSRFKY